MKKKQFDADIKVIKLGTNELECCFALDLIVFNGIWTRTQWEKELGEINRICFGIKRKEELIGFACGTIVLDEFNITLVAIHPFHQRCGLGKLIVHTLLNSAYSVGTNIATLEVKENNYAARSFYENLNFKKIGFRKRLYKDGTNAVIFKRRLNNNYL